MKRNPTENSDAKELDDLKAVVHSLRHDCENCKKLTSALTVISRKTGLSKARVEKILKKSFKD